ncbi:hypothetical protein [Pontibacter indicus]|uniref:Uncharacterized protein n=1 Tax=Pontibacter indicus TaxID=1317125 RepID=A0A1R3XT78_9BACT|nr:hypothetical protein [Pontibacter indicus]SIT94673.1 hypothetical protein SAMN05444128_3707 [Pontibacter indicus]
MKLIDTASNFFKERGVVQFANQIYFDEDGESFLKGYKEGESNEQYQKYYFILTLTKELKRGEKLTELGLKGAVIWETYDAEGNVTYRIGKSNTLSTYAPYEQLLSENSSLNYAEKLKAIEWREKRESIIKREQSICEICNSECFSKIEQYLANKDRKEIDLKKKWANVHHTYYVDGCLPWHYPNESLKLLCAECHQNLHESIKIVVYENFEFNTTTKHKTCLRCVGSGYLPEYYYYYDGVCFSCDGTGYASLKTKIYSR